MPKGLLCFITPLGSAILQRTSVLLSAGVDERIADRNGWLPNDVVGVTHARRREEPTKVIGHSPNAEARIGVPRPLLGMAGRKIGGSDGRYGGAIVLAFSDPVGVYFFRHKGNSRRFFVNAIGR